MTPTDAGDGWPGLARVQTSTDSKRVALHVSRVGSHSRAPYERRFQNPAGGELVQQPRGALPILIGLASVEGEPILVAVDGSTRVGRPRRFSILFHVSVLQEARLTGWSEYESTTGEHIIAMHPRLLPAFVDAMAHGVRLDALAVSDAAESSGLLDDEEDPPAERTRSVVSRLVRRAAFGKKVCRAYGNRCAMCGISIGLPEGAHIYPASAPNSPDSVWNGISLCRNHHRIFDLHRLWVSPDDGEVRWHPEVLLIAETEQVVRNFVDNTAPNIAMPRSAVHRPRPEMFEQRYEFVRGLYDWAH